MPRIVSALHEDKYIIDENGCWTWQKSKSRDGYARLGMMGKPVEAHRYFYKLYKGEIPEGMVIDHLCRNRACVNPEHLEAVTFRQNMRRGKRSKVNYQIAEDIRQRVANGETRKSVAAYYGIAYTSVSHIVQGIIWKDDLS